MRKSRKNSGFTIVELIIVIAVIGVLAAILIPTFSNVIDKANAKSAYSDAKNYVTGYVSDITSKGYKPSDLLIYSLKGGKIYAHAYEAETGSLVEAGIEAKKFDKNSELDLKGQAEKIADIQFAFGAFEKPDTGRRFSEFENDAVNETIANGGFDSMVVIPNVEVNIDEMTTEQVQSTDKFEYGNGTEEKPFIVADEEQVYNMVDLQDRMCGNNAEEFHFRLACDVDLNKVNELQAATKGDYDHCLLKGFSGTIDGAKRDGGCYKIIAPHTTGLGEMAVLVDEGFGNVTFKNLELVQDDEIFSLVYVYGYSRKYTDDTCKLTFENITVTNKELNGVSKARMSNDSSFVFMVHGNVDFINCVNNANLTTTSYFGIFVGGYGFSSEYGPNTIRYINCENYGRITGAKVGFFQGNLSQATVNLVDDPATGFDRSTMQAKNTYMYVENCANHGFMMGTQSCNIFGTGFAARHLEMENALVRSGRFHKGAMVKGASDLTLGYDGNTYTASSASQSGLSYKLQYHSYLSVPSGNIHFIWDMYFNDENKLVAPVMTGIRALEQDEYNAITSIQNGCFGEFVNGEYTDHHHGLVFKVERNADGTFTFVLNKQQIREVQNYAPGSNIGVNPITTTLFGYTLDGNVEVTMASRQFTYQNGAFVA